MYTKTPVKLRIPREVLRALVTPSQINTCALAVSVNCTQEGHSLCVLGCTTTVQRE